MNTEKSTTEPDIAGYLKIKRGNFWVQRYVEINNGVLFYYKSKGIWQQDKHKFCRRS